METTMQMPMYMGYQTLQGKIETIPVKYCLYARKSTEEDERQAMSIDSQIKEMITLAEKEGIEVVEIRKESHSAKNSGQRPVFKELLDHIDKGLFNGLLCWDNSRLSRNGGDLGALVDLMDQGKLLQIRTYSQTFINSSNDKFLLMILGSQAKLENDNRATNIRRGLKAKCQKGMRPGPVPIGYSLIRSQNFGESSQVVIDEEKARFVKKMFDYVARQGLSGRQVFERIKKEGFRTNNGKVLPLSMIYKIFKMPFYYGEFEYPKGSGNWFRGTYEAIITKEIFEETNKRLITSPKGKWGRKEFFFSKIFKCGACGSGITAEEKINRHGKMYNYYKCTKYAGNKVCKEKYITENKVIESIAKIVCTIKKDHFRLNQRLLEEVEKFNQMQKLMYGDEAKQIDDCEYVKFILKQGRKEEKADVLRCIEGKLFMKAGEIYLDK